MASEELSQKVRESWVGEGLRTEEIPVTVVQSRRTLVVLCPWCYICNLVCYVLIYFDDLDDSGLIYSHVFIPDNEIWLKVAETIEANPSKWLSKLPMCSIPTLQRTLLYLV